MSDESGSNFIRDIIRDDNQAGTYGGRVVTRFPPEPNGYLHIGHAKAICVNFSLAAEFGGTCHLRFDDTNPVTEDTEFVEGIKADIRWLGFDWGDKLFFASDFFGEMYDLAEGLIRDGKAYVCELSEEEFREYRGTVTAPGKPSPHRDRPAEESLDLLRRMRSGEFPDGHCVLRAKGDMASANMKMRDPPLYRIKKATHHRTGDTWCIYPMYDYAHPLEDALEDVTHSLCTLEFDNNRALYDWVIDNTAVTTRPRQYEFARLAISTVLTSKRKLKRLVDAGLVTGWDDPRMPTLRGLRRRGVPAAAIRNFCERVGVAKVNSTVELSTLEHAIRDALNHEAPRVMAVIDPVEVVIDNYPADEVEWLDASHWPHDVPREGSRKVPFTRRLLIEREDFQEVPEEGFKRLAPGREIRLRYGYFITCTSVSKDPTGTITRIHATHDPATRGGAAPDGRKVTGTIHWVSATESVPCTVRLINPILVDNPDAEGGDYEDLLNPDSLVVHADARVEPCVAEAAPDAPWQFERLGYFVRDNQLDDLVFNRAVALKDSWTRPAQDEVPAKAPTQRPVKAESADGKRKRKRRAKTEVQAELHAADPELAARAARYADDLGLSAGDVSTLTSDRALSDFFEAAIATHDNPGGIANWVVNAVRGAAKDGGIDALAFDAAAIGALVALIDAGTVSSKGAKDVFKALATDGGDPAEHVERLGLAQLSRPEQIAPLVDQVIADNPGQLAQYRGGNARLFGFFVGQVIQASSGRADPGVVTALLRERLDD